MNLPPVLAAAITLFATMWWGIAGAQNAPPAGAMTKSMEIRTLPGDVPVIDGRLDEAVWEQALIVDDLHRISPREYEAPY